MKDLLFYIMYTPALTRIYGKKGNALQSWCMCFCVTSLFTGLHILLLIPVNASIIKKLAGFGLPLFTVIATILFYRHLSRKYTPAKIDEVCSKYNVTLGVIWAKVLYWLIIVIMLAMVMSLPFTFIKLLEKWMPYRGR